MSEWNNPATVAVGLIPISRTYEVPALAGIIRGKVGDDGLGQIALVGGFVNEGESIEAAMVREVEEEISFKSTLAIWSLLYSRHVPGKNLNLVFCLYRDYVQPEILTTATPNEEVAGFAYIDRMTKLAFPLHEEAVCLFYEKYRYEL